MLFFSITVTRQPAFAMKLAAAKPAIPLPTMMTDEDMNKTSVGFQNPFE
jgi:hypothetical protein